MNNKSANGGIGFTSLLQLAFIVLKLCHVINWSWWAVFSPTLISAGIVALIIIIVIAKGVSNERRFKRR